jgi:hypothetical protein
VRPSSWRSSGGARSTIVLPGAARRSPAHIVGYREPGPLGFALDSAPVGGGNPQVDVHLFTLFFLTAGRGSAFTSGSIIHLLGGLR